MDSSTLSHVALLTLCARIPLLSQAVSEHYTTRGQFTATGAGLISPREKKRLEYRSRADSQTADQQKSRHCVFCFVFGLHLGQTLSG